MNAFEQILEDGNGELFVELRAEEDFLGMTEVTWADIARATYTTLKGELEDATENEETPRSGPRHLELKGWAFNIDAKKCLPPTLFRAPQKVSPGLVFLIRVHDDAAPKGGCFVCSNSINEPGWHEARTSL